MKLHTKILVSLPLIILLQFANYAQNAFDFERAEKLVDKNLIYFSENNPGAVVSIFKKGEIIFNKAYGLTNIQKNELMTTDKIFGIGEMSKSFTSVAILMLVEKKKLSLDNNLNEIFSDFPEYGKKIKVSNLLNHTSGLASYDDAKMNSNLQVYNYLKEQNDVVVEPELNWRYSNSDYAMLALIIEKSSEMTYEEYLRKNIFNKLSMNNTCFANEIDDKNIAEGHFKENDQYIVKKEINEIYGERGIYMDASDFAKWDKALYTDKLLKCENLDRIFNAKIVSYGKKVSHFNYGWQIMERMGIRHYWCGGAGVGYSSIVFHLPHSKTTVLLLTNRNDGYNFLKLSIIIATIFDRSITYKL